MQSPNLTRRQIEEFRPATASHSDLFRTIDLAPRSSSADITKRLYGPFQNHDAYTVQLSRVTAALSYLMRKKKIARLKQDGQYRYYPLNHLAVKGVEQTVRGKRIYKKQAKKPSNQVHWKAGQLIPVKPGEPTPMPKPQPVVQKSPVEEMAKEFVWQMTMAGTPEKITLSSFVEWAKTQ